MQNRNVCFPYTIANFEDEFQYPIPKPETNSYTSSQTRKEFIYSITDQKGIPILHPRPERYSYTPSQTGKVFLYSIPDRKGIPILHPRPENYITNVTLQPPMITIIRLGLIYANMIEIICDYFQSVGIQPSPSRL
jgi:hypothetical protein